jgi:hypothetical protein
VKDGILCSCHATMIMIPLHDQSTVVAITYSMVQDIIWKADSHSACQKISFLYGTRRFITVFTKARQWTLSRASRIQFFHCLGRVKGSVQVRGALKHFVVIIFLRWGVVRPTPNPQAGGPPFISCPRLLFRYIRSSPP